MNYIPNLSIRLAYLYEKLKEKGKVIKVSFDAMSEIFKIYDKIWKNFTVYFLNISEQFYICTDAFENGFYGVLY